jgi:hypothetical protein
VPPLHLAGKIAVDETLHSFPRRKLGLPVPHDRREIDARASLGGHDLRRKPYMLFRIHIGAEPVLLR